MVSDHNAITLRIALSPSVTITAKSQKLSKRNNKEHAHTPEFPAAENDIESHFVNSEAVVHDEVTRITLTLLDLQTLTGENWLNDQV